MPRDTSKMEPIEIIGRALLEGASQSIENMEAEGQRELVAEAGTRLPTKVLHTSEEMLRKLGFCLGPILKGDPLFREGSLPDGWTIVPTEHSMHSEILDDQGRLRASIFYKAAHYDRYAHITACTRFQKRTKFPDAYTGTESVKEGVWDVAKQEWVFLSEESTNPIFDNGLSRERDQWLEKNYPKHDDPTEYWEERSRLRSSEIKEPDKQEGGR